MPFRCYPCPRTPVTHVPRTNTLDKERGQKSLCQLCKALSSKGLCPRSIIRQSPSKERLRRSAGPITAKRLGYGNAATASISINSPSTASAATPISVDAGGFSFGKNSRRMSLIAR